MANLKHKLWTEAYRPKTIEEYIFQDKSHKECVLEMIKNKSIPHILMSGVAGSGKSTLAFILIDAMELDATDVLVLNASDENSVDVIRDKVTSFVSASPMGDFKIILLEEADYITQNGQGVMRRLMEEYSDSARFIITCNYLHKILPAIQSRFTVKFNFKASDRDDITEYVAGVLVKEGIKFDLDTLDTYIDIGYPDIRSILGSLQQYSIKGVLKPPTSTESSSTDYRFKLIDFISTDNWKAARELVCQNVQREEYEDLYRFLYDNISKSPKFKDVDKWGEAIIIIAEHLYKHPSYSDSEINAAAMFLSLGMI
jgi:replication factor C small subunit